MRGIKVIFNLILLATILISQGCTKKNKAEESQPERNTEQMEISGADKTTGNLTAGGEKVMTLNDVITYWDKGDKEGATEKFLSIHWDDPAALVSVPAMNLSEKEFASLSKGKRDSISEEYQNLRAKLISIVRYVRSVGDSAIASGDKQKARSQYDGILRCGQALSSPERLAIMQLDGKAIIKMAEERLSTL